MTDGYGNTLEVQEEAGICSIRLSPRHTRALKAALDRLGFPSEVRKGKEWPEIFDDRADSAHSFEETLDMLVFESEADANRLQDVLDSLQVQSDLENESVIWQRVC